MEKIPTKISLPLPETVDQPSDNWKIDKYQIIELLGKGSFSKVYRARNMKDKKDYAIKLINDERILNEHEIQQKTNENQGSAGFATLEDMQLSIRDESTVLKDLSHPNIMKFYGISEKGVYSKRDGKKQIATVYSVSEVCPNGDLWEYIEYGGKFKEKYCRYLFKQIIEALEYMHLAGFAHRDIKPANMLLDESFNLKLNDFGFATCFKGRNTNGKLGTIQGTPEYEAPELIKELMYYGSAVDIFAAGVTLFNMFTGKPAFKCADTQKGSANQFYVMVSQRNNNFWKEFSNLYWAIKDPDAVNLFPKDFKNLIYGLQAENPDKRFTIGQIKAHQWLKGEMCTPEEMIEEFKRRFQPMKYAKFKQQKCRIATYAFRKKFQLNPKIIPKAHFKK